MLTISPQQKAAFAQIQEQQFRQELCDEILQDYPQYAKLSPLIMDYLLGFALRRARGYGFTWQSTFAQFVYLMAAIAPNFDLHPAIHAGLANSALPAEERIEALVENLPDGVWEEAAAQASTLGWFLAEDAFAASPAARIAQALSNALPQDLAASPAKLETQVWPALEQARALGFDAEDGQFVFAGCAAIYGEGFETRLDWAKEALDPEFAPDLQVALLRVRIAIDTAAWL